MEKYKIVKNNEKYHIMEHQNEFIVKTYDDYTQAKKTKNHLNNGGGFNGFTPLFFTEPKYKTKHSEED